MSRLIDVLAGCVVGGALLASGAALARWGGGREQVHISMLKDNASAVVWVVNPTTGEARVVGSGVVPLETRRELARAQARQLGQMFAKGDVMQLAMEDFFQPMAEGAARVVTQPRAR